MSISAMKQALEALKSAYSFIPMNTMDKHQSAESALRQAIAEAEKQEGWVLREVYFSEGEPICHRELQPVAQCSYPKCQATNGCVGVCSKTAPVHASDISQERVDETAKDRHEPVAWIVDGEIKVRLDMAGKLYYSETNVYAAPPKREWVGLTDEEINIVGKDAWDCWHYYDETFTEIYRLLEAKLKEKNGG